MNNVAILTDIQQAKISETLRTIIRRRANENGGIASIARSIGINAHRYYNQLNRGNGVLAETIVLESIQGHDHPLRVVAEACGYEITPKFKFLRTAHPPKPVRSYGLDMHHATTMITRVLEEALADQRIDERELEKLKARLHDARKTLATFEAKITGLIP